MEEIYSLNRETDVSKKTWILKQYLLLYDFSIIAISMNNICYNPFYFLLNACNCYPFYNPGEITLSLLVLFHVIFIKWNHETQLLFVFEFMMRTFFNIM